VLIDLAKMLSDIERKVLMDVEEAPGT